MKKIVVILCTIAGILCFASCGMKECNCISTNVVTLNDSIISNEIDTVNNFTRGDCESFNKDETFDMDSVRHVHHVVLCKEN